MPRINLANRNVIVYDSTQNTVVGGCHQFGTTSIAEFFFCLAFFISEPSEFQLYHQESGGYFTRADEGILQTGNYFVASTSLFSQFISLITHSDPYYFSKRYFDCRRSSPSQYLWW
jgi:hypothetical protein